MLNADTTVILISQGQPPSTITTNHGITFRVLSGNVAQKWLSCMLTAYGSEQKFLDLQYHLQPAATAYHANKWIVDDWRVSISQRLRSFDAVVSSVACFASGRRTIHQEHIQTLDPHFRCIEGKLPLPCSSFGKKLAPGRMLRGILNAG